MSRARHDQGTYKNVVPQNSHNREDQGKTAEKPDPIVPGLWYGSHHREDSPSVFCTPPVVIPKDVPPPFDCVEIIDDTPPEPPHAVADYGGTFALLAFALAILATLSRRNP